MSLNELYRSVGRVVCIAAAAIVVAIGLVIFTLVLALAYRGATIQQQVVVVHDQPTPTAPPTTMAPAPKPTPAPVATPAPRAEAADETTDESTTCQVSPQKRARLHEEDRFSQHQGLQHLRRVRGWCNN